MQYRRARVLLYVDLDPLAPQEMCAMLALRRTPAAFAPVLTVLWLVFLSLLALCAIPASHAKVLYVNHAAPGPAVDGASWGTAYRTIQAAVSASAKGDEVWVARGVYRENVSLTQTVSMYGGFAGSETDRAGRAPKVNRTVLDGGGVGSVVYVSTTGSTPYTVDGFTIQNAESTGGAGVEFIQGIYCTIANCVIRGCGVGVNGIASNSYVSGCTLIANGRGVAPNSGILVNNVFFGNREAVGFFANGAYILHNTFVQNTVAIQANRIGMVLTNNLFLQNGTAVSQMVSSNVPSGNCTFENGINYDGIVDPVGSNGNIEANPMLLSPLVGEMHLQAGSPCVDAGAAIPTYAPTVDLDNLPRKVGVAADIGADEFDGTVWTAEPGIVRVSTSGDDANDGSDWPKAKRTVQAAVDALWGRGGEVWIAGGVYDEPAMVAFPMGLYGRFAVTDTSRSQRSGGASVLRGGEWSAALTLRSAAGPVTVEGFTVRDGQSGIAVIEGAPKIANCVVAGNVEGVTVEAGEPVLVNNTVFGNARGVAVYGGAAAVTNTIIAHNDTGVRVDAGGGGTATVRNSCIYGRVRFDGMADPGTADGNIVADPRLTAPDLLDIHLLPGSPCVDAGDDAAAEGLESDIDNQPRRFGTHVDIGADESDGVYRNVVPSTVFVSPTGSDANDGSNWSRAMRTIQAAVDVASVRGANVWVAAGTYAEPIHLRPFAYLYGGFAGTETNDDQRMPGKNPTVLTSEAADGTVRVAGGHVFTTLDGFIVLGGRIGVRLTDASAMVANNVFHRNETALESRNGSPAVSGNTITGGFEGLRFTGGAPSILNNRLSGLALRSVAAWSSTPVLRNNAITGSGEAGLYLVDSDARVTSNTFTGHRDAIIISGGSLSAVNNILAHSQYGVRLLAAPDALTVKSNCLFDNATPFQGLDAPPAEDGNFVADPKLANHAFGGFHLQPDSPCVDSGDPEAAVASDTDIDGEARVMNGRVDIGADESAGLPVPITIPVIRVKPDGDDANAGDTWATAKKTVQAGIDAAASGGEVWVAAGEYPESVRVRPFIYLYGGFAGTETERTQLNPAASPTVLAGDSTLATVRFRGGYTLGALDGFTLGPGRLGIFSLESAPTITGNLIEPQEAPAVTDVGGAASIVRNRLRYIGLQNHGILLEAAQSFVNGNTIIGPGTQQYNTYGGIHALGGAPVIASNVVTDCPTGITVDSAPIRVINNTVVRTDTGIYAARGAAVIANNNINTLRAGIQIVQPTARPVVRNNNVIATLKYIGTVEGTPANGSISADPLFVDAVSGDYRLRPASPCIDKGFDSAVLLGWADADGRPRLLGAHVDIGAYEANQPGILPDATLALRIAGGLRTATADDISRLSSGGMAGEQSIDLADAVRIIRQLVGLWGEAWEHRHP